MDDLIDIFGDSDDFDTKKDDVDNVCFLCGEKIRETFSPFPFPEFFFLSSLHCFFHCIFWIIHV